MTAALGLLIAYVLVRQPFHGRSVFEFVTMLSFAIPGTVIGLSYIFAFNLPPIELTGTGAILVICFVFRNMPVGIRAGVAAMSPLEPASGKNLLLQNEDDGNQVPRTRRTRRTDTRSEGRFAKRTGCAKNSSFLFPPMCLVVLHRPRVKRDG